MEIAQIDLFELENEYRIYLELKQKEEKKEKEETLIIIDYF